LLHKKTSAPVRPQAGSRACFKKKQAAGNDWVLDPDLRVRPTCPFFTNLIVINRGGLVVKQRLIHRPGLKPFPKSINFDKSCTSRQLSLFLLPAEPPELYFCAPAAGHCT